MIQEEYEYRGYTISIQKDDYADEPDKQWCSYVYQDEELLDGGCGFATKEEAKEMAEGTVDRMEVE